MIRGTGCLAAVWFVAAQAQTIPGAKPIPRVTAVPQPYHQVSFERDGEEIARYHFSPDLNRPFVYPVIGISGRTLTRMGHPGDPHGHSHHDSIWISFSDVNGVDFWTDHRPDVGRIVHRRVERLDDGDTAAGAVTVAEWIANTGRILLRERRQVLVKLLTGKEWILAIDLELEPPGEDVVLKQGQFGPVGVRVAKSISARFGGGVLRNSEGAHGEEAIFRRRARWVDYSGPVAPGAVEGLVLMDHPGNRNHPSHFHVREDGWMGTLLTHDSAVTLKRGEPLKLRYAVYVHGGMPPASQIEKVWKQFADSPLRPTKGPPTNKSDCLHGDWQKFDAPHTFRSQADCEAFVMRGK